MRNSQATTQGLVDMQDLWDMEGPLALSCQFYISLDIYAMEGGMGQALNFSFYYFRGDYSRLF